MASAELAGFRSQRALGHGEPLLREGFDPRGGALAVFEDEAVHVRNQASYHKCQGWIIRGFKYGLINALPMTSRAVWRRGRYGQFRDMLEQRKTTKFFNLNPQSTNKLGLSDAAVTIKFVSGSNSFITASSPTTLNPSDSGLYDFEGKSGQPWYDISVTF
jgi:hypothetical protein